MRDLCRQLEALTKGIRFSVSDHAPNTFESLKRLDSGLVVWAGASESTVWGLARHNWLFRAWHDSLHCKLNAEFTIEGETRVALEQARYASDFMARVLLAEVIAQKRYFDSHGCFPIDQLSFMRQELKCSLS